jgi:hypothetical protein
MMAIQYPMYNNYPNNFQNSNYPNQFGLSQQSQQIINPIPNQNQYQIQNGGFICVSSEEDARRYPVAPGNSVTFKNENAPYVYTKTMGFSQLDRPLFEKFRLVKEEDIEVQKEENQDNKASQSEPTKYLVQEDLSPLVKDIKNIQTKIKEIDSVLEGVKTSCDSSVKQIITTAKSTKSSTKEAK